AGHAVLAEAAGFPVEVAGNAAAGAVGKACTATAVAVHPGIEHLALDVADRVETDAAHMLDVDVADGEVDRAVGAVGHDLDAVALAAIALDGEVGQLKRAHVDAGGSNDLDHRPAAADLGIKLGSAEVDADRAVSGAGNVDNDWSSDVVAARARQVA